MVNINKILQLMESIDSTYIKDTINEISILDKYNIEKDKKNYDSRGIDFNTFEELCNIDPTTKNNNVGKYCNWLIAKYNPNINFNELKRCLEWFADGIKRNILSRYNIPSDINSFKTYEELIETMNNLNDNNDDLNISSSEYNNRNKLEGQFEVLGSNSFYDIIAPKTFEAERYFGGNTEWCTVANEYYFSGYMNEGQLYILYPKNGNSEYKMQFHFESESFADKYDNVCMKPLDCIESVIEDESVRNELIALCEKVFGKNVKYRKYFLSPEEILEFIQIELKNGVNPEELFDDVGDFYDEGLAIVKIENVGYNYITTENKILRPDLWFDIAYPFSIKGLAVVYIKDEGWNFIKPDGKILRDDLWFDKAYDFNEEFAKVYIKGRGYNFINTKGEILRDDLWFDKVGYFYNGVVVVYKDDYKYKLDTNGILYDMNGNKVDIPLQESKKYNNKKRRFD